MSPTARGAFSALLDLLYPPKANCMGCASPLGADVNWLCAVCTDALEGMAIDPACCCPVCGRPRTSSYCSGCADWPMDGLSSARFCYPYQPPADALIRRLKYAGAYRMAPWMAGEMARTIAENDLLAADLLVPVPMHRLRQRTRGFNQSALLAEALHRQMGMPMEHALIRMRNTKQQAKLSARARKSNLDGAFDVQADVENLRVLLVDDVLTTGTTANECAKALREAGAKDVKLIAFAGAV